MRRPRVQDLGLVTTMAISSLALEAGNDYGSFEFDVATPGAWSVSGLAGDDSLNITLYGPTGQAFSVGWADLATHPEAAFLLPGHYTIEVYSPLRQAGRYRAAAGRAEHRHPRGQRRHRRPGWPSRR